VLVFVDRLTKMTHLVATDTTLTAAGCADLFVSTIFRAHGLPLELVSDRDVRFTSGFWTEFNSQLKTKLCMSSAYHPQSDGQSERMNRLVEDVLRMYIGPRQDDWDEHLPLTEFAINNSFNASINSTPFRLNHFFYPRIPPTIGIVAKSMKNRTAIDYAKVMKDRLSRARACIQTARARQKIAADKSRLDVSYSMGDTVMLSTRNLSFKAPGVKKLCPKFIGPFVIIKVINPVAMQLQLPVTYKMHDVFHVSLLKPFVGSSDKVAPLPESIQDADLHYFISDILGHRARKHGTKEWNEFLVRWDGYGLEHDCWMTEDELRVSDALSVLLDAELNRPLHAASDPGPGGRRRKPPQPAAPVLAAPVPLPLPIDTPGRVYPPYRPHEPSGRPQRERKRPAHLLAVVPIEFVKKVRFAN
jgi:hypothetical protein